MVVRSSLYAVRVIGYVISTGVTGISLATPWQRALGWKACMLQCSSEGWHHDARSGLPVVAGLQSA